MLGTWPPGAQTSEARRARTAGAIDGGGTQFQLLLCLFRQQRRAVRLEVGSQQFSGKRRPLPARPG